MAATVRAFSIAYLVSLIILTGFHPFEIFQYFRTEFLAMLDRRAVAREAAAEGYYEPQMPRAAESPRPRRRPKREEMQPRDLDEDERDDERCDEDQRPPTDEPRADADSHRTVMIVSNPRACACPFMRIRASRRARSRSGS